MPGQVSSFVFVLAAAGLAASQSLSSLGLSQQCQNALSGTLLGNPAIQSCLNSASALNIFDTTANTSVVQPVNTWLEGICGNPACDNSTVQAAAQNITTGCQSDLSSLGLSQQTVQNIASIVVQVYGTARKVACLEDSKAPGDPLCVTEFLTDLQNIIGPLSINNIVSTVTAIVEGKETVTIPQNVTCNDCTTAAWATIRQDFPALAQDTDVTGPLSNQCGASFINATPPKDIIQSSGTASSSSGAALGMRVSFERLSAVAAVPLVALLAGSALLL